LAEYRRYKSAIRAMLPSVSFAGPDAAGATDWIERFATDEGRDLRLLTHHYYREGQAPTSTLDKLLRADPKLATKPGRRERPEIDEERSAQEGSADAPSEEGEQ